ncbi:hypothetical protein X997_4688 [Burkholderia pseudomallei A79C]|nr:hypothetical protein X997_4688 [Burkholderia pseudomallei A79C]
MTADKTCVIPGENQRVAKMTHLDSPMNRGRCGDRECASNQTDRGTSGAHDFAHPVHLLSEHHQRADEALIVAHQHLVA